MYRCNNIYIYTWTTLFKYKCCFKWTFLLYQLKFQVFNISRQKCIFRRNVKNIDVSWRVEMTRNRLICCWNTKSLSLLSHWKIPWTLLPRLHNLHLLRKVSILLRLLRKVYRYHLKIIAENCRIDQYDLVTIATGTSSQNICLAIKLKICFINTSWNNSIK